MFLYQRPAEPIRGGLDVFRFYNFFFSFDLKNMKLFCPYQIDHEEFSCAIQFQRKWILLPSMSKNTFNFDQQFQCSKMHILLWGDHHQYESDQHADHFPSYLIVFVRSSANFYAKIFNIKFFFYFSNSLIN